MPRVSYVTLSPGGQSPRKKPNSGRSSKPSAKKSASVVDLTCGEDDVQLVDVRFKPNPLPPTQPLPEPTQQHRHSSRLNTELSSLVEQRKRVREQVLARKERDAEHIKNSIARQYHGMLPTLRQEDGLLDRIFSSLRNPFAEHVESTSFEHLLEDMEAEDAAAIIDLTNESFSSSQPTDTTDVYPLNAAAASTSSGAADSSDISMKVFSAKCSICHEEQMTDPATIPCYHVFCYGCISAALSHSAAKCPICRKKASVKQIKRLYF